MNPAITCLGIAAIAVWLVGRASYSVGAISHKACQSCITVATVLIWGAVLLIALTMGTGQ